MNDLRRELAPIPDEAWEILEEEVTRTLKAALSVRKIADFKGPHGWEYSAVNLGRTRTAESALVEGLQTRIRMVLPLVELRAEFELLRDDIDSANRGARDVDVHPAIDAALRLASAEDKLAYYGYAPAGIRGICEASPHAALSLPPDPAAYPQVIAEARERLRDGGIHGPYALAFDAAGYTALSKTTVSGFPVLLHVRRLLSGRMIWAPALDGALLVALRSGDFEMTVGRDVSIGYLDHDAHRVRLYLEESVTFQVLTPEAAITLKRS